MPNYTYSISEMQEIINSHEFCLVDFWATWCQPCKHLNEILSELLPEFPLFHLMKIDISENIDLAQEYKIRSVPTILLFKNGILQQTILGMKKKDILQKIFSEITNKDS